MTVDEIEHLEKQDPLPLEDSKVVWPVQQGHVFVYTHTSG